MIRLGDPYDALTPGLAGLVERPFAEIEIGGGTGVWKPAPWAGGWTVRTGANDALNTLELSGLLGENLEEIAGSTPPTTVLDWLMRDLGGQVMKPQQLLTGRRIRLRTKRGWATLDWLIFEGFIERVELGWSGARGHRSLKIYAVDTAIAADRAANQFLVGQWRRCRKAVLDYIANGQSGTEINICVPSTAPLIFNPQGKPNCDPRPLQWTDGSKVYIPTDVGAKGAIPWTVAKMLRYLQWAALQPARPEVANPQNDRYDVLHTSRTESPLQLVDAWCPPYRLQFSNLDKLLAYNLGGTTVLDSVPDSAKSDFWLRTMLRDLANVVCEGMSVLEGLALLASRAGILLHWYHEFESGGAAKTMCQVSIRGHRWDVQQGEPGGVGGAGAEMDDGQAFVSYRRTIAPNGSAARGVPLAVAADQTKHNSVQAALTATGPTEGTLLLDVTGSRTQVRIAGRPSTYEITLDLLPGWKPNENLDIDYTNAQALATALEYVNTVSWARLFADPTLPSPVGRLWVLNEDGGCDAAGYKRTKGIWSTDAAWNPFDWKVTGQVLDLAKRGDQGWSCRARRFTEPAALLHDRGFAVRELVGFKIGFSFDAGVTYNAYRIDTAYEPDRCAVTILTSDLRTILDVNGESGESFVTAYIKGLLRVRVAAMIESDDTLYGYAKTQSPTISLPWIEHVQRDSFHRVLRQRAFNYLGPAYPFPAEVDDTTKADAMARRILVERDGWRASGQVTFPYLLARQDSAEWNSYDIGDEITAVETGDSRTRLALSENSSGQPLPAPRVVAVEHRYDGGLTPQMATTLRLETDLYSEADAGSR